MEKRIVEFLIKAKKATYAGKGREKISSRPMSHDLEFEEAELKYIDTYLGGQLFCGEEALWESNKPFWAMNYGGRVLSDEFEGDFLKESLLNVTEEKPFRGPEEYKKGVFEYKSSVKGDFDWFEGKEEIFKNEVKVYECIFHGGAIK